MKSPKYQIKEVAKSVFLVTFESAYDLAMTFLRYQEFYESPKFRGKQFTLLEYMDWYTKNVGDGVFSYADDYDGFNLPSWVLHTIPITDWNPYDVVMSEIRDTITKRVGKTFYLIGVSKGGDRSTVKHEIAHGMYTVDPIYHAAVRFMIRTLPAKVRRKLYKVLKNRQYHRSVFVDEANAFLSTGFHSTVNLPGMPYYRRKYRRKFQKVFEAFYEKNKVR